MPRNLSGYFFANGIESLFSNANGKKRSREAAGHLMF
jgi:hypothetical protein